MMRDCFPAHGTPCDKCGVRPDVACRHRAADPGYRPPVQDEEPARRGFGRGQGLAFGTRKVMTSTGLAPLADVLRNRRRQGVA